MRSLLVLVLLTANLAASQSKPDVAPGLPSDRSQGSPGGYLQRHNQPRGSETNPLVLRSFVPDPNLDPATVLVNHAAAAPSPHYSPTTGRENPKKSYRLLNGIPAAIAVNAGASLSYVWDTTECRLLYAWNDGFLDMTPYWGTPQHGRRQSFDYTPKLQGFLFYKADGAHPLRIADSPLSSLHPPKYLGYDLDADQHPVFRFAAGAHRLTLSIRADDTPQTLLLSYVAESAISLTFDAPNLAAEIVAAAPGKLTVRIRPNAAERHDGFRADAATLATATVEAGEALFSTLGCIACHTTDGGANHGPTLLGVFGLQRTFDDAASLVADDAYLRESITNPGARTVSGFQPAMMPSYALEKPQIDALLLYLKSLHEEPQP